MTEPIFSSFEVRIRLRSRRKIHQLFRSPRLRIPASPCLSSPPLPSCVSIVLSSRSFLFSNLDYDYDYDGRLNRIPLSLIVTLNRDLQSIFSFFDFRLRLWLRRKIEWVPALPSWISIVISSRSSLLSNLDYDYDPRRKIETVSSIPSLLSYIRWDMWNR